MGAANHGFLLLPETTNGGNLATTNALDATTRPRLVVTFDGNVISVPEPATLALLLAGAGTFFKSSRSRPQDSPTT